MKSKFLGSIQDAKASLDEFLSPVIAATALLEKTLSQTKEDDYHYQWEAKAKDLLRLLWEIYKEQGITKEFSEWLRLLNSTLKDDEWFVLKNSAFYSSFPSQKNGSIVVVENPSLFKENDLMIKHYFRVVKRDCHRYFNIERWHTKEGGVKSFPFMTADIFETIDLRERSWCDYF